MEDLTDWFHENHDDLESLYDYCAEIYHAFGNDAMECTLRRDQRQPPEILPLENIIKARDCHIVRSPDLRGKKTFEFEEIKRLYTTFDKLRKAESYYVSGQFFYYPEGGFMGWHTNSDAPGDRIYLSYTPSPRSSSFSYVENGKIIKSVDRKGITVRKFTIDEKDLFWHRVDARWPRLSIGLRPEYG